MDLVSVVNIYLMWFKYIIYICVDVFVNFGHQSDFKLTSDGTKMNKNTQFYLTTAGSRGLARLARNCEGYNHACSLPPGNKSSSKEQSEPWSPSRMPLVKLHLQSPCDVLEIRSSKNTKITKMIGTEITNKMYLNQEWCSNYVSCETINMLNKNHLASIKGLTGVSKPFRRITSLSVRIVGCVRRLFHVVNTST
jgi:hypothetical protein